MVWQLLMFQSVMRFDIGGCFGSPLRIAFLICSLGSLATVKGWTGEGRNAQPQLSGRAYSRQLQPPWWVNQCGSFETYLTSFLETYLTLSRIKK